jgi:hypothetical protein
LEGGLVAARSQSRVGARRLAIAPEKICYKQTLEKLPGLEPEATLPGPRPTPTHLRSLNGNPSHRPINRNEPQPPIPPERPEPPHFLSPSARDEWWRIAGELHALGLLTALDVMPLAAYCAATGRFADAERLLADG